MTNADLSLPLEDALKAYLESTGYLTAASPSAPPFAIYCAHLAEAIAHQDYLVLIAGRPTGDAIASGNPEITLEFQLHTSEITNEARRLDAVALHDTRAAAIEYLWSDENFAAARAALNAAATVVGFTGWEASTAANPGEADGRTVEQTLLTRLLYTFDVFRL